MDHLSTPIKGDERDFFFQWQKKYFRLNDGYTYARQNEYVNAWSLQLYTHKDNRKFCTAASASQTEG